MTSWAGHKHGVNDVISGLCNPGLCYARATRYTFTWLVLMDIIVSSCLVMVP